MKAEHCSHPISKWKDQPHTTRPGWIKTYCACGQWMGDRPVDVKAYRKAGKK